MRHPPLAPAPASVSRPVWRVAAATALLLLLLWVLPPDREEASWERQDRSDVAEVHALHHAPSLEFCRLPLAPAVCAHGGDASETPPNTARAFQAAAEAGVRCVEVDAAMTRARRGKAGAQCCNKARCAVGDFTLEELRALRWERGEGVELVGDVLEMVAPFMDLVVVDVKPPQGAAGHVGPEALARAVVAAVRRAGCGACMVWAKEDAVVEAVKSLFPDQASGAPAAGPAGLNGLCARGGGTARTAVGCIVMNETEAARREGMGAPFRLLQAEVLGVHHAMVDRQLVAEAQARGKQVLAWTANTARMMRVALDAGVDAIVTDRLRRLQHAIEARPWGKPPGVRQRKCQELDMRPTEL
eukprot:scaffold7.g3379.t1